MSTITNLVGFVIKLVFRLTVQLVLELLKLGILSLVLLASLGIFVLTFALGIRWSYQHFNGDLLAVTLMAIFLMASEILSLVLIQYFVRDVLHLTDMSLTELAGIVVKATLKKSGQAQASHKDEKTNKEAGQKLD